MKLLFFFSAFALTISSCKFKVNVRPRYYSNDQLVTYANEKRYPFDFILKFKSSDEFNNRNALMINRINFMNVYSKDNYLLKSSDGDNCEFKIAAYIKDSIKNIKEQKELAYSLNTIASKTDLLRVSRRAELLSDSHFKILIGWSISLNNFSIIKKRLDKLFAEIDVKSNDFVIVGLNLDPVK